MAGTLDSAIERKQDKKQGDDKDQQKVSHSGGAGEGDSSATKDLGKDQPKAPQRNG